MSFEDPSLHRRGASQPDHAGGANAPVLAIRGLLTQVARHARDGAATVDDWEAQSLLATTVEVLKCLDEAYDRYERRHPASASAGPGEGTRNHLPGLDPAPDARSG